MTTEDQIGRDTRRVTLYIKIAELAILVIVAAAVIYGMITWRNVNNASGRVQGHLEAILEKVDSKVDQLDVKGVNDLVVEARETVRKGGETFDGLRPVEKAASDTIATVGRQTATTMQVARQQIATIGPAVNELRQFTADTNRTVNSAGGLIPMATASIAGFGAVASKAGIAVESLSGDGHALLTATTPRVEALLASGQDLIVESTGRVRELGPIEANLAGVSDDLHRITKDSADKYHSILFPPPVHGVWPHIRQVGEYLIKPVIEGTRIYFQLTALPVRITQPIPILKP